MCMCCTRGRPPCTCAYAAELNRGHMLYSRDDKERNGGGVGLAAPRPRPFRWCSGPTPRADQQTGRVRSPRAQRCSHPLGETPCSYSLPLPCALARRRRFRHPPLLHPPLTPPPHHAPHTRSRTRRRRKGIWLGRCPPCPPHRPVSTPRPPRVGIPARPFGGGRGRGGAFVSPRKSGANPPATCTPTTTHNRTTPLYPDNSCLHPTHRSRVAPVPLVRSFHATSFTAGEC